MKCGDGWWTVVGGFNPAVRALRPRRRHGPKTWTTAWIIGLPGDLFVVGFFVDEERFIDFRSCVSRSKVRKAQYREFLRINKFHLLDRAGLFSCFACSQERLHQFLGCSSHNGGVFSNSRGLKIIFYGRTFIGGCNLVLCEVTGPRHVQDVSAVLLRKTVIRISLQKLSLPPMLRIIQAVSYKEMSVGKKAHKLRASKTHQIRSGDTNDVTVLIDQCPNWIVRCCLVSFNLTKWMMNINGVQMCKTEGVFWGRKVFVLVRICCCLSED
ncbi:hypothetical protein Syun_021261 [Stephania yunnanensis]|uniref:Uncharacterized protein n=1 Tax=Stephania yunnanensis TaxID=152371 RepID=A0AAP0IFB0_9MAGN